MMFLGRQARESDLWIDCYHAPRSYPLIAGAPADYGRLYLTSVDLGWDSEVDRLDLYQPGSSQHYAVHHHVVCQFLTKDDPLAHL